MIEELVADGWTHFSMDVEGDDFYRGEIRKSTLKGFPADEIGNVTDFASFIPDRSMLNIPPDVTCVAIITKKPNSAEVLERLNQKPKSGDGSD